jgi:NADH-quinone oxidoreductase subunit I
MHRLRIVRRSLPGRCHFCRSSGKTDAERFSPGERYARVYEINLLRCIFCGFCEDSCPTEAIVLRDQYELSIHDRKDAFYTKEMLLEPVPEGGKATPQVTEPGMYTKAVPIMLDPQD